MPTAAIILFCTPDVRKTARNAFQNLKHFSRPKNTLIKHSGKIPEPDRVRAELNRSATTNRLLRATTPPSSSRGSALQETKIRQSQMQPMRMALFDPAGQQRHLQNQNQHRRHTIHTGLRRLKRTRKPPNRNQTILPLLARINRAHVLNMVLQLQLPLVSKPPPIQNGARTIQIEPSLQPRKSGQPRPAPA